MNTHPVLLLKTTLAVTCMFAASVSAGNVMKTKTVDGLRIELHVLPVEPFFTADEVAAKKVSEGMLIISGAAPVAVDDESRPNHHLVVHVFDVKTGKAVTDAVVEMSFRYLGKKGTASGAAVAVPVVVMEAVGKGAQSTHYGNNVTMEPGSYAVIVTVNGKNASFKVTVTESDKGAMQGMDMH